MKSFWVLLGLAFVDLAVAGVMAGRGERGLSLLFMVLAVLTAAFALFAKPEIQRNHRGRLEEVEPPFAKLLGVAGALAILGAATYVAVSAGGPVDAERPSSPKPAPTVASQRAPEPRFEPRAPARRPDSGNWLHKCVDPSGHASFQSAPCPPGSRQEWRRAATPENEPARSRQPRISSPSATTSMPAYAYPRTGTQPVRKEKSAACRAAREADRRYRRLPLKQVTHAGLRYHGDAIREACG